MNTSRLNYVLIILRGDFVTDTFYAPNDEVAAKKARSSMATMMQWYNKEHPESKLKKSEFVLKQYKGEIVLM